MGLGVDPFAFTFLGICWASWICRFMFSQIEMIPATISCNILSVHFSFYSPSWDDHYEYCLMESHRSLRLSLFSFPFFPFFSSDWIISIDISSGMPILSSAYSNLLFDLIYWFFFSFLLFYLSTPEYLLVLFYTFYQSIWWDIVLTFLWLRKP